MLPESAGKPASGVRNLGMPLSVAILITLAAAGAAVLAFALVHHLARGPLLMDSGRGRPAVTVTGTAFAVLLAFVILAAFQTYDGAKSGLASEAQAVLDMARTADLFPAVQREQLRSDLTCYGRAVVSQEWPAMRDGRSSPLVEHWVQAYRTLFARLDLHTTRQQLGFQELLSLAATRTTGRQQRLDEDSPTVPTPLWLALIFAGFIAVALQLGMVDPRERLSIHALLVAGLASVVAAGLLVVYFLDHPYQRHVGGIQPIAMQRTLISMRNLEPGLRPPCSQTGRPI
jgi:hypothetical protein